MRVFLKILQCLVFTCLAVGSAAAQSISLAEMAGQMILVGFNGDSADSASFAAVRADVAEGRVGGVMFLAKNVSSLAEVGRMNAALNAAAQHLPPFIALDQEGGSIERLTAKVGFAEIPSAAQMAGETPGRAERVYADLAARLRALGFNLNFGPVVDLNINKQNPIIARYGRSFGDDAASVAAFARAFVQGHRKHGVLTALKHFPGHGSSAGDSHEGFVDVTGTWQARELEPYRILIAEGAVDMIMIGHLFHERYGEGGAQLPASLSRKWISGILREQLGFDGVSISDDLEMGAIRARFGLEETVTRAVRAGMDILLFSNTADYRPSLAAEVQAVLVEEALEDPLFRARIEESYARIAALKSRLAS